MNKDQERDFLIWPMYTEVNRLKQVFRHIEGIPIPLPVPITVTAIGVGVLWVFLAFQISWGDPLTKYVFLPLILMCVVSYLEPDQVSPIAWIYARIRNVIRPQYRIMNRVVPPHGFWREYCQYSIVRKGIEEESS